MRLGLRLKYRLDRKKAKFDCQRFVTLEEIFKENLNRFCNSVLRHSLLTNHIVCEKRTRATVERINQTPDLLRTYAAIIRD